MMMIESDSQVMSEATLHTVFINILGKKTN